MSMMDDDQEGRSTAEQVKLAADLVLTAFMIGYLVWTLVDESVIVATLTSWRKRLAELSGWTQFTRERSIRRQAGHVIWEAIKTVEGTP
jgi:hypothetical protein